ncbi:unnamed protein product [Ixodes pacificus]
MVARFLPASRRGLPKRLLIALTAKQVTQPSAFHGGLVAWLHKTGHMWRDVSTLDAVSCRIFSLGLLAYCLGLDLELDPLYWRIPKKLSCCQSCKCSFWKICANHCLEFFISIHPVRGLHKPIYRSPAQPGLLSPGPGPARSPLSIVGARPGPARQYLLRAS